VTTFCQIFENGAVQTKMVAVCFFETPSSIYQLIQRHASEERRHQFYSPGLFLELLDAEDGGITLHRNVSK
jgi:hypothetical protein